jgi:hypothetical protein
MNCGCSGFKPVCSASKEMRSRSSSERGHGGRNLYNFINERNHCDYPLDRQVLDRFLN